MTTTQTTNEDADRLRIRFRRNAWDEIAEEFDAALATERRNVVAEIRRRAHAISERSYLRRVRLADIAAILDELEGEDRPGADYGINGGAMLIDRSGRG